MILFGYGACLRPRGENETGEKNQQQNADPFHAASMKENLW
jgi:hypothetical protein